MPIPVSLTSKRTHTCSSSTLDTPTLIDTSPAAVNFTALAARLSRIWRMRPASPRKTSGTAGRQ